MDVLEQSFDDLLDNTDIEQDDDIQEEVEQDFEPLIDLSDSVAQEENTNPEEKEDPEGQTTVSNYIESYFKEFGINDMSKIQMQNEAGEVEEVNFNSLSEEEKLNILKELSNPGITEQESQLINYLRQNNVSFQDVIEYNRQQAIKEYLEEHPEDAHQRYYSIDDYTDDEVYLADLKNKYPNFSDEELVSKLDSAKMNEELFNKEVAAIRENQKAIEEEQIKQQEEQEAQSYQELQQNLQQAMSNFTQIELDPEDKSQDALMLDITDEDRTLMMRYLVEKDKNGKSQLVRDLEDPQALIELAYYRTRERDNITGLTRYWKNELANERKEKAKLQKELDKIKNKGKNSSVVSPQKNNTMPKTSKTLGIMDIYG